MEFDDLVNQELDVPAGYKGKHLKLTGMPPDNIQRVDANRPGRAKEADLGHLAPS